MIGKIANAKRIVTVGANTLVVLLFVVILASCDIVRWQNPFVHPSAETPLYMKWVKVTGNAPVFPRINFSATVFDGSIWIAGGRDENDEQLNDIWRSPDGSTWSQVTDNGPFGSDFAFAAFGGFLFVYNGANLDYSADGADWTNSVTVPFDAGRALRLAELESAFWAVDPETGRVWRSEDPTQAGSWTEQTDTERYPGVSEFAEELPVVAHDGALWVTGGDPLETVWRYRPGDGWSDLTDEPEILFRRSWIRAVSHRGRLWNIGGWALTDDASWTTSARNDAWYSSDGTKWTETRPDPSWKPRERFGAVVFNDRIYIFGGAEDITDNMYTDVWYTTTDDMFRYWD